MFSLCMCAVRGEMRACERVCMHTVFLGDSSKLRPARLRHRHQGLTGAASSQAKSFNSRSQRAERW